MASVATTTPKVSWLKRVGQVLGKILGFIGSKAVPIVTTASSVASVLFPAFAPEIAAADSLVTKIAQEAVAVEGAAAAANAASGTGAQKLEAVLANIGPVIDTWVASAFPGAAALSTAAKAGLVNAVVAILNEVDPGASAGIVSEPPVAPPLNPSIAVAPAPVAPPVPVTSVVEVAPPMVIPSAGIPPTPPAAHTTAAQEQTPNG